MGQDNIQEAMAEAIRLQLEGKLPEARQEYENILAGSPDLLPARHNLGIVLLNQGWLEQGLSLVTEVVRADSESPDLAQTFREVGLTLYRHQYWELARQWLEEAVVRNGHDMEAFEILQRVRPRSYLAPEIFDPLAGQVLKRYSPRESATYVYTIEVSGTCNLRCPSCPQGNFKQAIHPKGLIDPELFNGILQKIAEESPVDSPEIWLFNWGEPFLHPKLAELVAVVKQSGFSCHLSTNLNRGENLDQLIAAGPDELKISLSGFTQESYAKSHKGGDLSLVKKNMHRLRDLLDSSHMATRVWLCHHLYHSTVGQSAEVKTICDALGFQYQPIQAFYMPLEKLLLLIEGTITPKDEPILADLLVPPRDTINHIRQHRSGTYDCELRFNQTVINYDGTVALCCGIYDQANMLGVNFLNQSHREIEALKYRHPFCAQCRLHSLDYSVAEFPDTGKQGPV